MPHIVSKCVAINMDLLRDWLAPTIQHELSQALQWKEKEPGQHGPSRPPVGYSDDGSNLRVQSSENGVVQISKVTVVHIPTHAAY